MKKKRIFLLSAALTISLSLIAGCAKISTSTGKDKAANSKNIVVHF